MSDLRDVIFSDRIWSQPRYTTSDLPQRKRTSRFIRDADRPLESHDDLRAAYEWITHARSSAASPSRV